MLTVGILVGAGLRKLPSNAKRFEYGLSVQTGLRWRIQAVEYRSPGCVRLKGVEIIDDISTKSIFEAVEVDFEYRSVKNREKLFSAEIESRATAPGEKNFLSDIVAGVRRSDGFWMITVPNSVIKLDHYDSDETSSSVVWSALSKMLARSMFLSETPIQFAFENIGVFSAHSRNKTGKIKFEPLHFVRGNLYRTDDGVRSDWSFQMPEVSQLETQRLSFVRRDLTGGVEIELRTGKIPVPIETVSAFCPLFGRFGAGSRFSGDFSVEYHSDTGVSRTARLINVVFQNIDVAPIASYYTSFPVSGTVDSLHVRKAVFGPDAFFADGAFMIDNGEIDATLFNRFVQQFELTVKPGELLESPRAAIPFEKCALQFRMQQDGIAFWPDENWNNVFMFRSGDGFRTESITVRFPDTPGRPISYHAILSVLAPDTAPVVPLTPNLKKLYSVIPVEGDLRLKRRSPETSQREILATTPVGSKIMEDTVKNTDRILAAEPLSSPAPTYPAIANPVTDPPAAQQPAIVPLPKRELNFIDPRIKKPE